MSQDTVVALRLPGAINNRVDVTSRKGARQLIRRTVQVELAERVETNVDRREGKVRPAVVRNG